MIFGFDIGIASCGWAVFDDVKDEIISTGVRIFEVPENSKDKSPLAMTRRIEKSSRKRLKARKSRLLEIKKLLCQDLSLEKNEIAQSFINTQFELRAKGLKEKLEPLELAKVILHIAKHRGYDDIRYSVNNDKDKGKVLSAISKNENELKNKMPSVFLLEKREQNAHARLRNGNNNYINTITQSQNKTELEAIINKQREFGYKISDEITEIAFKNKELQSFADKVGNCIFYTDEKRASKFAPCAVKFIAFSKITNKLIQISKLQNLYNDEKWDITDKNGEILDKSKTINAIFAQALKVNSFKLKKLRDILGLDENFALPCKQNEDEEFLSFSKYRGFLNLTKELDLNEDKENALIFALATNKGENLLKEQILKLNIDDKTLRNLMDLDFKGFVNLSIKAIKQILPFLEQGYDYTSACELAGLKKPSQEKNKLLPPLSSKKEYAITNPVVNRTFSQFRLVLNELIKKYGSPSKINFELTREVGKNATTRKEYENKENQNAKDIENAKKICQDLGLKITSTNILKIRLWKEQKEFCAYSNEKITTAMLLAPNALEIDHILPYSRSFDDSYSNKVLVLSEENQLKGDKTPFEAFSKEKFENIRNFAQKIIKNHKKYKNLTTKNFQNRQAGFMARNLNDTSYVAVLIKNFVSDFIDFAPLKDGKKKHVLSVSGALTSAFRYYMGFAKKDRSNDLHHALDACVIALCNDALIQKFSEFKRVYELEKARQNSRILSNAIKDDYLTNKEFSAGKKYRTNIQELLEKVFVSRKVRAKVTGALHEQTIRSLKNNANAQNDIALGKQRAIRGGYVDNGEMPRIDIFTGKEGNFYAVPIYTMDFASKKLPNKASVANKSEWLEMDENYEFKFSLYKNDLVAIQKAKMSEPVLCYYVGFTTSTTSIKLIKHDRKYENLNDNEKELFSSPDSSGIQASVGIKTLKVFKKMIVSPLGEVSEFNFKPKKSF